MGHFKPCNTPSLFCGLNFLLVPMSHFSLQCCTLIPDTPSTCKALQQPDPPTENQPILKRPAFHFYLVPLTLQHVRIVSYVSYFSSWTTGYLTAGFTIESSLHPILI